MLINEAKTHLDTLLSDTMPVFLMGAPGIGKSSIVKQICSERKWDLIDLRLTLLNPIDLRGLPYLNHEKQEAVWLRPEFLPKEGHGILFLDELNLAPIATQQAAYELLLDRRIGTYRFPDNWRIIAAGNREEDMAYIQTMPSPLANRMIHLNLETNVEDWMTWAVKNIDERVIGFIRFRDALLSTVPKKEEKAFPTPRSWEFVSRILKLYDTPSDAVDILNGTVGAGAAGEFLTYILIWKDMPDIDAILAGKDEELPKKTDVYYAVCSSLVKRLKKDKVDNFLKYVNGFKPEFAVLCVRDAAKAGFHLDIQESKYWDKFSDKFSKYLV